MWRVSHKDAYSNQGHPQREDDGNPFDASDAQQKNYRQEAAEGKSAWDDPRVPEDRGPGDHEHCGHPGRKNSHDSIDLGAAEEIDPWCCKAVRAGAEQSDEHSGNRRRCENPCDIQPAEGMATAAARAGQLELVTLARVVAVPSQLRNDEMVEIVKSISAVIVTCSEFTAVVVIVIGALHATGSAVAEFLQAKTQVAPLVVFRGFAGWLVLALEVLLAAEILRTAISPTWNEIGQLAAIAAIRTFLSYSLGHDLRHTPETKIPNDACKRPRFVERLNQLGSCTGPTFFGGEPCLECVMPRTSILLRISGKAIL